MTITVGSRTPIFQTAPCGYWEFCGRYGMAIRFC